MAAGGKAARWWAGGGGARGSPGAAAPAPAAPKTHPIAFPIPGGGSGQPEKAPSRRPRPLPPPAFIGGARRGPFCRRGARRCHGHDACRRCRPPLRLASQLSPPPARGPWVSGESWKGTGPGRGTRRKKDGEGDGAAPRAGHPFCMMQSGAASPPQPPSAPSSVPFSPCSAFGVSHPPSVPPNTPGPPAQAALWWQGDGARPPLVAPGTHPGGHRRHPARLQGVKPTRPRSTHVSSPHKTSGVAEDMLLQEVQASALSRSEPRTTMAIPHLGPLRPQRAALSFP